MPDAYPRVIKCGHAQARIYKVNTPTGPAFTVAWNAPQGRKLKKFKDPKKAEDEARVQAAALARFSPVAAAQATTSDLEELALARRIAGNTPLLTALREWRAEKDRLSRRPRDTVAEVVNAYLAEKKRLGVRVEVNHNTTGNTLRLAFGHRVFADLTDRDLDTFLQQYPNAETRNTFIRRFRALWAWAQERGLCDPGRTAAHRLARAETQPARIGILSLRQCMATVEAMKTGNNGRHMPALALALFCGLRRTEVHGQRWEDIDISRKILRVTVAKRNTPAFRLVTLRGPALALLGEQKKEGPVTERLAVDGMRRMLFDRGLEPDKNAFRHSFISYLVARTGSIDSTAHEAGNSPAVIFRHYRALVSKQDAAAFWALR